MITSIKLCLHDEVGSHANQVEPKFGIEKYFFETPVFPYNKPDLSFLVSGDDIKWNMPPWGNNFFVVTWRREAAFHFAGIHALWK